MTAHLVYRYIVLAALKKNLKKISPVSRWKPSSRRRHYRKLRDANFVIAFQSSWKERNAPAVWSDHGIKIHALRQGPFPAGHDGRSSFIWQVKSNEDLWANHKNFISVLAFNLGDGRRDGSHLRIKLLVYNEMFKVRLRWTPPRHLRVAKPFENSLRSKRITGIHSTAIPVWSGSSLSHVATTCLRRTRTNGRTARGGRDYYTRCRSHAGSVPSTRWSDGSKINVGQYLSASSSTPWHVSPLWHSYVFSTF